MHEHQTSGQYVIVHIYLFYIESVSVACSTNGEIVCETVTPFVSSLSHLP